MRRRRNLRPALGAALLAGLATAARAEPDSRTYSAPGGQPAAARLLTWDQALARQAELDANPRPRPPRREEEDWWDRLPEADRKYIARGEYQDPYAIIAARKRMAEHARTAREAVARGEAPPKPWKRHDPARGHRIRPQAQEAPSWYTSWAGLSDGGRPSDSVSAVGPAHVGVMVNSRFAFYTKDGALAVGPVNFEAWWFDAPVPFDLFDPKIVYDNHAGRWILLAINGRSVNPETYFALAISQTSNPEGAWWIYYLRSDVDGSTDTDNWADYPGLGFDSGSATNTSSGGAVYISSNQYARGGGGGFQRGKFRVIPKWQLYNGLGVGWWDFWNSTVFTWKPAATYTSTGATPTEYLIHTMSSGATWLTKWTLTNPLGSPPSLGSDTILTGLYGVPPNAQQLGGGDSNLLDTGDCRTQDVQYRNGYLYTTAGDFSFWDDLFDTDAVVHYWKIQASSGAVAWDGYFGFDDESFFHGKIQVDAASDATVVFSHASPSLYARIGMTGILASNGTPQSYVVIRSGAATYNPSGDTVERWGDYNGLGFDCAGDQKGAWGMSQVAISSGTWQSWIGGTSFGLPNVYHLSDGAALAQSQERYFTWRVLPEEWGAVALVNGSGGDDDVYVSATCPFGSAYQGSAAGGDNRDFTVTNGTQYAAGGAVYHHAWIDHFSGATGYTVEVRSNANDTSVGELVNDSLGSTRVLDLFQAPLSSGKTYAAVVDITNGNADLDLWMFKGSRPSGGRMSSDGGSHGTGTGTGGDEVLVFTATESSRYGFAVTNENSGSSSYTFKIWLKPVVAAIGNASLVEGSPYTGPTPTLSEGTTPVTWSLDAGPAGLSINPTTGVVSWASPTPGVHTVTIRATNPAGFDTESWTLTVAALTSTPTRTSTPTATTTRTSTSTATSIPTSTPTPSAASTSTPSETATAVPSNTPTPSATSTVPPSETATAVPSETPTPSAISTPSATRTEVPTQTPTASPTLSSTATSLPEATASATPKPEATVPGPGTTVLLLGLAPLALLHRRRR
jgi:hypothetical protein